MIYLDIRRHGTLWSPSKYTGKTTSHEKRPGTPAASNIFLGPSSC